MATVCLIPHIFQVLFVSLIRSFHEGMFARVQECGESSDPFPVTNGTKQGCVLAPTLFVPTVFSLVLLDTFQDLDRGVYIQFRSEGGLFNLRRLQARTKTLKMLIRDMLFADDCALVAHSLKDIQLITDMFPHVFERFGLTISIKKTEVMYQPAPDKTHTNPVVTINNTHLKSMEKFCYMGSILSSSTTIDDEITQSISKANSSFGRLRRRLWNGHGVKLSTKIKVYHAVVLTSLLYSCETWTTYRHHIKLLEKFQQRCLRSICNIKWQDRISNIQVLERCGVTSVESQIVKAQLRWVGHLTRMDDSRIPKAVFYSQLSSGKRSLGRPRLRYKDTLKQNLKACSIDLNSWEVTAKERAKWRHTCHVGIKLFETNRTRQIIENRLRRKASTGTCPGPVYTCGTCSRVCGSRIGLLSHERTHH